MGKYIRTKDGIWKYNQKKNSAERPNKEFKCNQMWLNIEEKDILKKANTIEELCDVFVIKWTDGTYCRNLMDGLSQAKYWLSHDNNAIIYGAIFTDRAIIYVAELNRKGELELL